MRVSSINSNKILGLDSSIWFTLIIVSFLSLGLLGYKLAEEEECLPASLSKKNLNGAIEGFKPNETIQFTLFVPGSNAPISWDFGDKSPSETGSLVSHIFNKPGNYEVIAKVNGRCEETTIVKVEPETAPIKPTDELATNSNLPSAGGLVQASNYQPMVNQQVTFSSNLAGKTYEWTVEGPGSFEVKTTNVATYSFPIAQRYTVKLMLDNNPNKVYSAFILVAPLPKPAAPIATIPIQPKPLLTPQGGGGAGAGGNTNPAITTPVQQPTVQPTVQQPVRQDPATSEPAAKPAANFFYIKEGKFQEMLEAVISGTKNVSDFKRYLCDGENTEVIENGKTITFEKLCQNIGGEKRKIISVSYGEVTPFENGSKCVKKLIVKHEKKGFKLF